MNCVQTIRDKEKIGQMKTELQKNETRDYLIFCLGINTGLRISDIIKLKVKDILNQDRTIKIHINGVPLDQILVWSSHSSIQTTEMYANNEVLDKKSSTNVIENCLELNNHSKNL